MALCELAVAGVYLCLAGITYLVIDRFISQRRTDRWLRGRTTSAADIQRVANFREARDILAERQSHRERRDDDIEGLDAETIDRIVNEYRDSRRPDGDDSVDDSDEDVAGDEADVPFALTDEVEYKREQRERQPEG